MNSSLADADPLRPSAKIDTDPYLRAMFGENAVKVPFNAIIQADPVSKEVCAVVVIRGHEAVRLMFGSTATHQLIIGDAVVRPFVVMESEHLVGSGISGLAKSGFDLDGWIQNGRSLIQMER